VEEFITRHSDEIVGVLEGWDRVLFRGTLTGVSYVKGMMRFLWHKRVLLKDFMEFGKRLTAELTECAQRTAASAGREYRYLSSAQESKDQLAEALAARDRVREGLVCVLACVEPCMSYEVRADRGARKLLLEYTHRKCRFFYFYFLHPQFGLMHVRLQSWFPFQAQVCINGRSYLERRLIKAGMGYRKRDNCFVAVSDVKKAQAMLDDLIALDWRAALNRIVGPLNPLIRRGGALRDLGGYYWTIRQSEYATDVMFKDEQTLAQAYPHLIRHAVEKLGCEDVLRFLGQKLNGNFRKEVTSARARRPEGVRVKHRVGANSIKMYDKQGSVLRVETTINDPGVYRVWRPPQTNPAAAPAWQAMRKAVADISRRAEVSRAANHRYLRAMSVVEDPTPAHRVLDPVSRSRRRGERSYRGLRPVSVDDAQLFTAVLAGEHVLNGFANGDIRARLFRGPPRDDAERNRRIAKVGRQLRLLREHGLIQKVNKRRLYRVTPNGQRIMALALTMRGANSNRLLAA